MFVGLKYREGRQQGAKEPTNWTTRGGCRMGVPGGINKLKVSDHDQDLGAK